MATDQATKICTVCKVNKPLSDYYADRRTKDGKCQKCKRCWEKVYKCWKSRNREKWRSYNHKWYTRTGQRYKRRGLTEADYRQLEDQQGGVCGICKQPETIVVRGRRRPLHIDHDHATGTVRGLLCSACNTGIGKFRDNPRLLRAAVRYLEQGTSDEQPVLQFADPVC